jgi:hypothetical protein
MFRVAKAFILEITVSFPEFLEGLDSARAPTLEDLIAELGGIFLDFLEL